MKHFLIACSLACLLGACATTSPVIRTKTIYVKVPEYRKVPTMFLARCPRYPKPILTNGDLLSAYEYDERSLVVCNDQLGSLRYLLLPSKPR